MRRRIPHIRRAAQAGALALLAAGLWADACAESAAAQKTQAPPSSAGARPVPSTMEARPGPRVMLCLYGADGHRLAGNVHCPVAARPQDAMMPEAHCFYDREGRLWRGLPRCPRTAPPFLLEEAARAD